MGGLDTMAGVLGCPARLMNKLKPEQAVVTLRITHDKVSRMTRPNRGGFAVKCSRAANCKVILVHAALVPDFARICPHFGLEWPFLIGSMDLE
jgi:hypothetical protein